MSRKSWTHEEFREAVRTSFSRAQVFRKLGLNPYGGGNYRCFNKYVKQTGANASHFTGQAHLRGRTHNWTKKRPLSEVLVRDSDYLSTSSLKRRLIKEGVLTELCSKCGIIEWQDERLSLHLDHVNGVHTDNRLANLRLLCPNCHSQTPTYCGKKSGSSGCKTKTCSDCQKPVHRQATRCKSCAARLQPRKFDVTTERLSELVHQHSMRKIGRMFGVSDNAIRKRCRRLSIDIPKRNGAGDRTRTCTPEGNSS